MKDGALAKMTETSKDNFDKGWEHWHSTGLQRELNSVRESYGDKIGKDSGILNEITEIAGSRRYSHKMRWEMIGEKLSNANLSDYGRDYVAKLADVACGYITKSEKLKSGRVKLAREVKYRVDAAKKITEIKREHEGVSGIQKLIVLEESLVQNRPELVYHPAQQETRKPGFWSRIGKAAAVAACVMGGIVTMAVRGNKYETNAHAAGKDKLADVTAPLVYSGDRDRKDEDIILRINESLVRIEDNVELANLEKEKAKLAREYDLKLAAADNEKKDLSEKLKNAGRPDAEIVDATKRKADVRYLPQIDRLKGKNKTLAERLKRYEDRDAASSAAEQKKLTESRDIYKIVSKLNMPEFPLARARIDPKTGVIKEILAVEYTPQRGFSLVDTPEELKKVAGVVSRLYTPGKKDSCAFENLASSAGVDSDSVNTLEGKTKEASDLDNLVLFSQEFAERGIISWGIDQKGNVVRNPTKEQIKELKEVVVVGSLNQIQQLKN